MSVLFLLFHVVSDDDAVAVLSDETSNDDTIEDDGSIDDQITTDHEFQTNSNSGVYSLLMSATEYADWIGNDDFRQGSVRNLIFEDIYKKFPDEYDFIFLVLNEPNIPEGMSYYGMLHRRIQYNRGNGSKYL